MAKQYDKLTAASFPDFARACGVHQGEDEGRNREESAGAAAETKRLRRTRVCVAKQVAQHGAACLCLSGHYFVGNEQPLTDLIAKWLADRHL